MSPAAKRRVLLVDDHPMMREGFIALLSREHDLCVCGEAETAEAALAAASKLRPALVLADITLPGRNGIELIKDLHAVHPAMPILVISMHDESLWAERALRAGASGYIMKREPGRSIIEAIRRVLAGGIYVSEKMAARILQNATGRPAPAISQVETLTDREFEVFQLLGSGKDSAEIAGVLRLSAKTVDVHRANIRAKLGLRSSTEMISFAARWAEAQGTR
jgi:DNA-binding NarL/FixJ family response regulator